MQFIATVLSLLTVIVAGALSARAADEKKRSAAAPDLEIAIAVPIIDGQRPIFDTGDEAHFHVVLRNRGASPLRLWRNGNSWGHAALWFEVTEADGKPLAVRRQAVPFLQNAPTHLVLEPGGMLVVDIYFAGDDWQSFLLPPKRGQRTVKMRAIYEVAADQAARQHNVWTGKIATPAEEYRFESRR